MVATDSCDVEPVVVDSVFVIVGERATVKVKADQPAGQSINRIDGTGWVMPNINSYIPGLVISVGPVAICDR